MRNELELGPPVTIAAMFMNCEGGCGRVVRIDAGFCDLCAQLDHMFEAKREMGLVNLCDEGLEHSSLPHILVSLERREWFHVGALLAGVALVVALVATPFVMGCVGIWQFLFGK